MRAKAVIAIILSALFLGGSLLLSVPAPCQVNLKKTGHQSCCSCCEPGKCSCNCKSQSPKDKGKDSCLCNVAPVTLIALPGDSSDHKRQGTWCALGFLNQLLGIWPQLLASSIKPVVQASGPDFRLKCIKTTIFLN